MNEHKTTTDAEKLTNGLKKIIDDQTPDDKHWCPQCEAHADFVTLQRIERSEFNAVNEVIGCPNCRHTTIDATAWQDIDQSQTES